MPVIFCVVTQHLTSRQYVLKVCIFVYMPMKIYMMLGVARLTDRARNDLKCVEGP